MTDIQNCWTKTEAWLMSNARKIFESLNQPASVAEITELEKFFEKNLNSEIPEDLRQLYLKHNGQDYNHSLFYGLNFLTIADGLAMGNDCLVE